MRRDVGTVCMACLTPIEWWQACLDGDAIMCDSCWDAEMAVGAELEGRDD